MTMYADARTTLIGQHAPVDRPVGWYRDPADARRHRYWDGDRWLSQPDVVSPGVSVPLPRHPDAYPAA